MRSPEPPFDLRAALSDELRAAIGELETAAADPAALHRCRVRLKRARALARVGRACAPGLAAVFNQSARGVMRMMARSRDLAALAQAARGLGRKAKTKERAALAALADELDAEREALPASHLDAAHTGLRDLLALAQVWPEPSARQIRNGGKRLARRARRARRRGLDAENSAHRHKWRKREKDRHYAALLLGPAWPGKRRRRLGEKLSETLGRERDAQLLIEKLRAAPEDARRTRALAALTRQRARLARRADALGARLQARGA